MSLRMRVLAVVVAATSSSSLSVPAEASSCWRMAENDNRILELINDVRSKHGLSRLVLDAELSRVASLHTDEMADAKDAYHSSLRMLERRVTNWRVLGENVAVGRSAGWIHDKFMKSRSHRKNILAADFHRIGVGTERRHGRLWVTVMFATRRDPGTRLAMRKC